jgi:hypothetical protein
VVQGFIDGDAPAPERSFTREHLAGRIAR